jgi:hypothetical protein
VDAVKVTRNLGLKYIWIDSICIIQDFAEDWNTEAGKMASVYANAYVTLFADSAENDDHGFLSSRKVTPSMPLTIREKDGDNSLVTIHIRNEASGDTIFDQDTVNKSHISNRAWILQERILSRRRLHFGTTQVYWMCREAIIAEDGARPKSWGMRQGTEIHRMMKSPQISDRMLGLNWSALVKLYSTMILTNGADKLPALSGLAGLFHKMSHHEYIAGIWKENLAPGLAWYVNKTKSIKPSKYRAPSFSWACVDEEITFRTLHHDGEVAFVSSDIVLEGSDLFGKIRSGRLVLSGLMQRGRAVSPEWREVFDFRLYDSQMREAGRMWYDARDDFLIREVMCLRLVGGHESVFLVLVPIDVHDKDCAVYRRVGLGDTKPYSRFFNEAQSRVVTIV